MRNKFGTQLVWEEQLKCFYWIVVSCCAEAARRDSVGVACYVGRYFGVILEKEKIENNWWASSF